IEAVWMLSIPAASVAVLLYGGTMIIHGRLSIGDLMMFSAYMLMLLGPPETLVSTATTIPNNLPRLHRLPGILHEPTQLPPARTPGAQTLVLDPATPRGRITISRMSFSYPGHTEKVLSDISLDIAPGQTVALVGPSGSGKTSLCNLVARFYDPTQGAISLDGV